MNNKTLIKLIFSITLVAILVVSNLYLISIISGGLEKIAEAKKEIIVEQNKKNNFSNVSQNIRQLDIIQNRIENALISEDEVVGFIDLLEDIAEESQVNVSIDRVDFKEPENDNKLGLLSMNLSFSGSWESVNFYIKNIEELKYTKRINSIRFSKNNQNWSVNFTLEIRTN